MPHGVQALLPAPCPCVPPCPSHLCPARPAQCPRPPQGWHTFLQGWHVSLELLGVPGECSSCPPARTKCLVQPGKPQQPQSGAPQGIPRCSKGMRLCWVSERGCAAGTEPLPVPAGMTPFGGTWAGRQAGRGLGHSVHLPVPHHPQGLQGHQAAREKRHLQTALLLGKS